jgi:tetratricopeptide (TPR) repeat protein
VYALMPVTNAIQTRFIKESRAGGGAERRVALALIINAHFQQSWGNYDEVVKMMDAAETWCPTLAEVPNTRAIAYIDLDGLPKATADLSAALRLSPSFGDAYLNLAFLRSEQGRGKEALTLFDQARKAGATYPATDLSRCLILGASGRLDEALAAMAEVLKQPRPPQGVASYCWQLSSTCSEQRRYADAERLTRQVIALQPTWSSAWTKLSGDLGRQGKFAEAVEATLIHLDDNGDAVDGKLALATWYAHLGRLDEAATIVNSVREPEDTNGKQLYHGSRAIYAAAIKDEEMLRGELKTVLAAPKRYHQVRWIQGDMLFDKFREKPWFKALFEEPVNAH